MNRVAVAKSACDGRQDVRARIAILRPVERGPQCRFVRGACSAASSAPPAPRRGAPRRDHPHQPPPGPGVLRTSAAIRRTDAARPSRCPGFRARSSSSPSRSGCRESSRSSCDAMSRTAEIAGDRVVDRLPEVPCLRRHRERQVARRDLAIHDERHAHRRRAADHLREDRDRVVEGRRVAQIPPFHQPSYGPPDRTSRRACLPRRAASAAPMPIVWMPSTSSGSWL